MAVKQKDRRYRLKKPRPSAKRPRSAPSSRARPTSKSPALPGWNDLTVSNERRRHGRHGHSFLERISTTRFVLLVAGLAVFFTLYVGHVHATQDIVVHLQQERRENLRLHLKYNRLKGDFDEMVGPSVIYRRAHGLGLVEDPAFGATIEVPD